jgi:hypothetical protein
MKRIMAVWVVVYSVLSGTVVGQLGAGNIAVVAFNTDSNDEFAWVALRDLPANTRVCFTDSSVSNGCFRWSEHLGDAVLPGPLTWTHTNAVPAGTVVTWGLGGLFEWSLGRHSGGRPALSSEGDQLVVYCGTIVQREGDLTAWRGIVDEVTLIFALNFANGGWDNVTGGSTTMSFVPAGLSTNAGTAVHVDHRDNGHYSGIRTGTAVRLLQSISISTNWATSDEPYTGDQWPGAFQVLSDFEGTTFSMH